MSTSRSFKAGLVQTRTGRDVDANLVATTALIREAVKGGAVYVQTLACGVEPFTRLHTT